MKYYLITNANILAPDYESRFPNVPKTENNDTVYGVSFNVNNERHELFRDHEIFIRFKLGEGNFKIKKITNSSENYYEIYASDSEGFSIVFRPFEIEQITDSLEELENPMVRPAGFIIQDNNIENELEFDGPDDPGYICSGCGELVGDEDIVCNNCGESGRV